MRRAASLLVLLVWTLSTEPGCTPVQVRVWDDYIEQEVARDADGEVMRDADGNMIYLPVQHSFGWRSLPLTQTQLSLASGKPDMPGCAIAWAVIAVDAIGVPLPAACQPTIVSVDGLSWEGM